MGGLAGAADWQSVHFIRKQPLNSKPFVRLTDLHEDSYHFVHTLTLINEVFHLIGNKNKWAALSERMFFIELLVSVFIRAYRTDFHMIVSLISKSVKAEYKDLYTISFKRKCMH